MPYVGSTQTAVALIKVVEHKCVNDFKGIKVQWGNICNWLKHKGSTRQIIQTASLASFAVQKYSVFR